MIWGAIIVPVIAVVVLLLYFRTSMVWWEYCLQFFTPILLISLCWIIGQNSLTSDTEYLGAYIVECKHEEPFNEYIYQTCTRTVSCGKNCETTETYDCSYVLYHPEQFYFIDSNSNYSYISNDEYKNLVNQFGNESKIGHHSGYTISGDILSTKFTGSRQRLEPVTTLHTYKNKVQAANNVINFPEVSKAYVQEVGLYDYGNFQRYHVPAILGNASYDETRAFDVLNAVLGRKKQIRIWVLIYDNKAQSIVQDQINYWKGSNKNELVICIGEKEHKLQWANVFTWSDSDNLRVRTRDKLMESYDKKPDLVKFAEWLEPEIENDWRRKEFKDFEYLVIDTPTWAVWVAYIISVLASVGLGYWNINNEFDFYS